jgi:hypothetical protein
MTSHYILSSLLEDGVVYYDVTQSCTIALQYDRKDRTMYSPAMLTTCNCHTACEPRRLDIFLCLGWIGPAAALVAIGIPRPCLVLILLERRRDEFLNRRSPKIDRIAEIVCNFVVADDTSSRSEPPNLLVARLSTGF